MKKAVTILLITALLLTFTVTKQVNAMQDIKEIWKDVVGYEGMYQVSNLGNVKNTKTDKHKKQIKNWAGYARVQLCISNIKIYSVHRLVAIAFLNNPDNLPEINHIDHNRSNNNLTNLEWCTRSYNAQHSFLRNDRKRARAWLGKFGSLHHGSKPVQQILNESVINEFACVAEAGRALSLRASSISRCCLGERKTYAGFKWKYI